MPVKPGIGIEPDAAGAVGAGDHQPVQHAGEYRTLQREAEVATGSQAFDHRRAAGLLPQAAEDQRRPNGGQDTKGRFTHARPERTTNYAASREGARRSGLS